MSTMSICLLKALFTLATTRRSRGQPRRRAFVPRLEVLEDRALPSTFTVTNLLDSGPGSLRAAVTAANANPGPDSINFATTGTITLTSGQLDITDSLTINGPGAKELTLSGNNTSRVFSISGGPAVTIEDLTIANGKATDIVLVASSGLPFTGGGGILVRGGSVTVDHTMFTGNVVAGGFLTPTIPLGSTGGGILVVGSDSSLAVDHSTFTADQATGSASLNGAIGAELGAAVTVSHSTFTGNAAVGLILGASGAIGSDAGSTVTIDHSSFTDNLARAILGASSSNPTQGFGAGGAVGGGAGTQTVVSHCSFSGNEALGGSGPGMTGGKGLGGAIFVTANSVAGVAAPATFTVDHSTFTESVARPNLAATMCGIGSPETSQCAKTAHR
jgi:hypothetical protein